MAGSRRSPISQRRRRHHKKAAPSPNTSLYGGCLFDDDGKKDKHLLRGGTVIWIGMALLIFCLAVYKPLPEKMCESTLDRIAMHIIEPVMRLSYYYPTRLCPDALCMMKWTRSSLNVLAGLVGPIFDYDAKLHMETTEFDGVKVRVYHPRRLNATESDGAIVFIHGGGFVLGNVEMYESLTRTLAKMVSTRLFVSIDYRKAPETFFPGGLEDCERVLEYVMQQGPSLYGIDPSKVILMGDSAGGNLVAAVTQRRQEAASTPKILGQVLLYPLLQFSDLQSYSYRFHAREMEGLAVVDPLSVAFYYLWYAGVDMVAHPQYAYDAVTNGHVGEEAAALRDELVDHERLPHQFKDDANGTHPRAVVRPNLAVQQAIAPFLTNPDFAPLMRKNVSGLPTAFVMTMEFDVLRDEGATYAERMKEAGVRVTWKHYEHGFHAMLNFHSELQMAQEALRDIRDWTMSLLRDADRL